MSSSKMQRITREHVSRPRTCAARQNDRVNSILLVHSKLGLNHTGAKRRAVGIVSTGHIDFDIAEAMLGQMSLECCKRFAGFHVGYEAQIEFGHRPMGKNSLSARTGIAANQSLNIYRRAR